MDFHFRRIKPPLVCECVCTCVHVCVLFCLSDSSQQWFQVETSKLATLLASVATFLLITDKFHFV